MTPWCPTSAYGCAISLRSPQSASSARARSNRSRDTSRSPNLRRHRSWRTWFRPDSWPRGQDPVDRRRYALELTDLGWERLATLRDAVNNLQADLVKTLGGPNNEEEIHTLIHKLLPPEIPERSNIDEMH